MPRRKLTFHEAAFINARQMLAYLRRQSEEYYMLISANCRYSIGQAATLYRHDAFYAFLKWHYFLLILLTNSQRCFICDGDL